MRELSEKRALLLSIVKWKLLAFVNYPGTSGSDKFFKTLLVLKKLDKAHPILHNLVAQCGLCEKYLGRFSMVQPCSECPLYERSSDDETGRKACPHSSSLYGIWHRNPCNGTAQSLYYFLVQLYVEEFGPLRVKFHITGNKDRKVWIEGMKIDPKWSQTVINHSPDGFAWGYGGSGPAQLAVALMMLMTGEANDYQLFKEHVIARLPIDKPFDIVHVHTYRRS